MLSTRKIDELRFWLRGFFNDDELTERFLKEFIYICETQDIFIDTIDLECQIEQLEDELNYERSISKCCCWVCDH